MKLLGSGSTKNIYFDEKHPDKVALAFSDRVSVFDYGSLADQLPGKGAALKSSAVEMFQWLAEAGIAHAADLELSRGSEYLYLATAKGAKFSTPEAQLEFLPVEVIFRWGVPEGSSLLKRGDYKPYDRFSQPLVEFTTKLEEKDRLLSEEELNSLIGQDKVVALRKTAAGVARVLDEKLSALGFELWDGKIECAWDANKQQIVVVDSIGPDELRMNLKGLRKTPLSKELLRQWLSRTNWAHDLKVAKEKNIENWREVSGVPPRLGLWRQSKISGMYQSLAKCFEQKSSEPIWIWLRNDALKPKVYVHGGGGREAAVKWRLEQEGCEILESAESEADLYWVSMDGDLADGLADDWEAQGRWVYGPRKNAAELEWSKSFGREIASKAELTQPFFTSSPDHLSRFKTVPVIKKNALAAGKGVVLPHSMKEAEEILRAFSKEGDVLLEERCHGPEASAFFAVSTGYHGVDCKFLGSAQDFKRRFEGDEGPNTGGMGSYVPNENFDSEALELATQWTQKTAETMAQLGRPYNGILYLGLMKDENKGWVLIEFNSRFGDPETQALVKWWPKGGLLRSILNLSVVEAPSLEDLSKVTTCLALVRPEYPKPAPANFTLPEWGFESNDHCVLFRARSVSGRVAYLVGQGQDRNEAGDAIFEVLLNSPWKDSLEWRKDILP